MNSMRTRLVAMLGAVTIAASTTLAAVPTEAETDSTRLMSRIRKQLITLPFYGVFDNLSFRVDGDIVTLNGQAVRPSTRRDAERRVAKLEGVERVINNIEVLPLSRFDDSIRVRTYQAIFRSAGLYRYALGANPSLHIIVNRGHVTLEGFVANKFDSRIAYVAANQVSGVFSVTNNLSVEHEN